MHHLLFVHASSYITYLTTCFPADKSNEAVGHQSGTMFVPPSLLLCSNNCKLPISLSLRSIRLPESVDWSDS